MGNAKTALQRSSSTPVSIDSIHRQRGRGKHNFDGGAARESGRAPECAEESQFGVPSIVHEVLRSDGQPLERNTRAFMEPRFAQDFSRVPIQFSAAPAGDLKIGRTDDSVEGEAEAAAGQALSQASRPTPAGNISFGDVLIHTGEQAAQAASTMGARAFTVGRHIVFNQGEYQPHNGEGRQLLAHELAHVVQQTGPRHASATTIRRKVAPGKSELTAPSPAVPLSTPARDAGPPSAAKEDADAGETVAADEAATDRDSDSSARSESLDKTSGTGKENAKGEIKAKAAKKPNQGGEAKAGEVPGAENKDPAKSADGAEAQSVADLATEGLALIDEELAEHQRWGAAAATVGGAGSAERAKFITKMAASGAETGLTEGLVQGAKTGAGIKIGEKILEKGIARGAAALAARLGTQVGKFTPIPGVGAAIGGALAAYDLASRDWKATGEAIGRFGKGASIYDELANTIEAVSTVLEVATQVLNVIAGILGVITIVMWILSVVTVGAMSPVAGTLTTIALAIGIATLILDAINALVLKKLIMMFRALHTFSSEADPRDVVTQGAAISQAAGAASGFVGGFVGGMAGGAAVGKGVKIGKGKPAPPVPEHPTPAAASGDGPTIKAQPPVEGQTGLADSAAPPTHEQTSNKSGTLSPEGKVTPTETSPTSKPVSEKAGSGSGGEPPSTSKASAPANEASFAGLNDLVGEMDRGPFGDKLQSEALRAQQPPPTAPTGTRWGQSGYRMLRRRLRGEQAQPPGTQAQHWTKWLASTRDTPISQRMTPEMISQNRSWLQTNPNRPATLLLTDPRGGGTRYFIGEQPAPRPSPQLQLPGFEQPRVDPRFTTEHRFADNYLIPEAAKKMPAGTNPNQVNLWSGAEARWRAEGTPGQGNWGWQPRSSAQVPVQLPLLPKSGPQIPRSATRAASDPRQLSFNFEKTQTNPSQLDLFSQSPNKPPTATLASPRIRVATEDAPPAQTKIRVADEATSEGGQSTQALAEMQQAEETLPQPMRLRLPNPALGRVQSSGNEEPESGLRREPIVERVNPNYPPPPCMPNDIVAIQNQILQTLDARAEAEATSTAMAKQETHHKDNEKPLANMQKGTGEAISATEAHKQAVERRTEANKQKQEKEKSASTTVSDYSNRAAELTTITVPMRAFCGFASLAYSLPDTLPESIRVVTPASAESALKSGKRNLIKMHTDSKKFLGQLDSMDKTLKAEKSSQGEREKKTGADANTLSQTANEAKTSDQDLDQAKQKTQDLDEQNKDRLAQATSLRTEANQTSATLDTQAQQKRSQVESLSAALDTWAQNHKQARLNALEQTQTRLEQAGYKVTEVKER